MSAKMNWERVRQENRSLKHGSDWVDPGMVKDSPRAGGKYRVVNVGMDGCKCGKMVGFSGEHRKKCPLSVRGATVRSPSGIAETTSISSRSTVVAPTTDFTLSMVSITLRKAGLNLLWKEFCRIQLRAVASDKSLDEVARADVVGILTELSKKL